MRKAKKTDYYQLILYVSIAIFIIQITLLAWVNLTQMQYHMGYDASSYYTKAIEMWRQKTVFCKGWSEQTTLYIDSAVPLAALFYGMTKNIFVAYGMANLTIDIAIIAVFVSILRQLKLSNLSIGLILNLLLCPYIATGFNNANDVGYFSMFLTSAACYGFKLLIILMVLKTALLLENDLTGKKELAFTILTCSFVFIAGLSSGYFMLVTVVLPCMIYILIKVLVKNNIKEINIRLGIFLMVCVFLIFAGKYIAVHVIGFVSKDSTMEWVSLKALWNNIGAVFAGYLYLLSALPISGGVEVLTGRGMAHAPYLIISTIILFACIYFFKKEGKLASFNEKKNYILLVLTPLFNIIMFSLLSITYGQELFETRYLLPCHIIMIILVGYFIDTLSNELIIKKLGVLLLAGTLLAATGISYTRYITMRVDVSVYQRIMRDAKVCSAGLVYSVGSDSGIDNRNMRAYDDSRIYKYLNGFDNVYHWGDYHHADENAEYEGPTLMFATIEDFDTLPVFIKNHYEPIDTSGKYRIYRSSENIMDFVSGMQNGSKNIDFMYSPGLRKKNAHLDENGYLVNDAGGIVLESPYCNSVPGIYQFILEYDILEGSETELGNWQVLYNGVVYAEVPITHGSNQVVIPSVNLETSDGRVAYRVDLNDSAKVQLKRVVILEEQ